MPLVGVVFVDRSMGAKMSERSKFFVAGVVCGTILGTAVASWKTPPTPKFSAYEENLGLPIAYDACLSEVGNTTVNCDAMMRNVRRSLYAEAIREANMEAEKARKELQMEAEKAREMAREASRQLVRNVPMSK
jgi:hypothetical protein